MQQRQPRLGDVLDDYCPRERRLTNHVVVAMIGDAVKQTRCSTCDADHEYKAAKMPRLRRKTESPAALAAQGFGAPKLHEHAQKPASDEDTPGVAAPMAGDEVHDDVVPVIAELHASSDVDAADIDADADVDDDNDVQPNGADEGPVHRRLIRASLPRIEGQAPPTRPNPEFTIRQPNNGRQNRFRPRPGGQGQGRGPMTMNGGNGGNGNGNGNRSFGGGGYSQPRQPNQGQGGGQNRRHGGGGGRNRPK
jgi:hypothetical protein